mmetsp:Transcript_44661/g.54061  ORF Transcript_44661/g.54061 Transcript_44661/m.54061 type:complete len:82 (+) Transcript_44661:60-305(+)
MCNIGNKGEYPFMNEELAIALCESLVRQDPLPLSIKGCHCTVRLALESTTWLGWSQSQTLTLSLHFQIHCNGAHTKKNLGA